METLIDHAKSSLLLALSNACLLWYTTDDKIGKVAVFDKKKWLFALYVVCTVKYFGNMSDGSINLKELESESGQLIEIAKYLFSILHSNRKQKAYQESLPLQILSCIYSSVWDSTTSIMDLWVNIRLTKQFCYASTIYDALFENATRL